jgi:hypothetical protein
MFLDPIQDDVEDDRAVNNSLAYDLYVFAILFNLPRSALKYLLEILVKHGVDVPVTPYKLKKVYSNLNISNEECLETNGVTYIGIKNSVTFAVDKGLLKLDEFCDDNNVCFLDLQINVDGLPLYKSSAYNLWPILMKVKSLPSPLPVGMFCGFGKPQLNILVDSLAEELTLFKTSGVLFNNFLVKIKNILFVCDAPARAFLQCVKGHSGYFGCSYCRQKGEYVEDHVVFCDHSAQLRSDNDYASFLENNQKSVSPLSPVVPLYSCFPPEFMHLVCLGVVRKVLNYFFLPTKGERLPCKLSVSQISQVSDKITYIRKFIPSDFQRKLRPISAFVNYKATELRSFLLYFGPFLLKKYLPVNFYKHFLLLHFACYVYCSPRYQHLYQHSERLLEIFVKDMERLFGKKSLVYNIHALLHLPYFVSLYGCLDSFSSFPFENFLSLLKKRVRATRHIGQHCVKQLLAVRSIYAGQICKSNAGFYTNKSPNNCAILDNDDIVLINALCADKSVSGYKMQFSKELYDFPYASSTLKIAFYKVTDSITRGIPFVKCISIPIDDEFLVLPYA